MNEDKNIIDGVNFVMRDAEPTQPDNKETQNNFENGSLQSDIENRNGDDHMSMNMGEKNHENSTYQVNYTYEESARNVYTDEYLKKVEEGGMGGNGKKSHKGKKAGKVAKKLAALVASAAVFGLVAGGVFQVTQYKGTSSSTTSQTQTAGTSESTSIAAGTLENSNSGSTVSTSTGNVSVTDVSGVVENVMPAIVAINCSATQTTYDFFGRSYDQAVSGSGSGIIISATNDELLIVTNNHVVDGATAIEIVFADDSKAVATVKGTEPSSDLAVVSVAMSDLTAETKSNIKVATLGDSDDVKIGEMAIAIGNALGYGQSVTVGYISALDREVTVDNVTLNLLQTDAAINPGNSGGALINPNGEIIGINSVKYTDTDVEGIGYAIPISAAIPISYAVPIINDLMNREELAESEMAYLGITSKELTTSFSDTFGIPAGVYIYEVQSGTPAEEAGLHQGDIITGIAGRTITDFDELKSYLDYTKAGTTVEITYKTLENGTYVEKTTEITLTNRPSE